MNKIINKDIFLGLNDIDNNSVDLIYIDTPYNLKKQYADNISDKWESQDSYLEWLFQWLEICLNKLKPYGSLYIMNTTQNMPYIDIY